MGTSFSLGGRNLNLEDGSLPRAQVPARPEESPDSCRNLPGLTTRKKQVRVSPPWTWKYEELMSFPVSGEYSRDQWNTIQGIRRILSQLPPEEIRRLEAQVRPYLLFREELEQFQALYFGKRCRDACFETRLSACCGFESIFTFFADHVVHFLVTGVEEGSRVLAPLARPNRTDRCVYLGPKAALEGPTPVLRHVPV